MRLFFAIPLPDETKRALTALRADLGKARWVPPEQLHLTLRFLGELDEARAATLASVAICEPRFSARARGVGTFGPARRPRVLWTAIEPADGARAIASALDACAETIGVPPEARPFRPHVTLARFKEANADRVRRFLAEHAAFASDPFEVREVILYRSTLDHRGAVHEPYARFALR